VYLPRAVTELSAKRVENEVVVQFTVPALNTDGSGPADLRRVEVYAHTGPLPAPADFVKYGTLVASIRIADPREKTEAEGTPGATGATGATGASGATGAGGGVDAAGTTQPASSKPEADTAAKASRSADLKVGQERKGEPKLTQQGELISVREALTEKHREIGPMPPAKPAPPPLPDAPIPETIETPGTVNFDSAPIRFYTVFGVSESRGRRGPAAGPLRVPLLEPLMPPEKIDVGYTEAAISLTWPRQPEDVAPAAPAAPVPTAVGEPLTQETIGTVELYADRETEDTRDVAPPPPAGAKGPAKPSPAAAAAAAAAKAVAQPTARFGYNVYETSAPGAPNAPIAPSGPIAPSAVVPAAPIAPLNTVLLTAPTFSDPRVEFGVERCYVIRRVEMSSGIAIEGAPTPPVCVTPVDTFPPAAPKNVQAISGGEGVSLLWEANTEPDFGGYLVLRGEAPGDKLSPLTPAPISDTSFSDTTVRRGRTYVYEVVAVDTQKPANRSAPSNRVEETIR
jgi:hypothetical protein